MGLLFNEYEMFCGIPSDINEHMPTLYNLALQCKDTVEFGVGFGRSTRSFLAALETTQGRHRSYEFKLLEGVSELFQRAANEGLNATFNLVDIRSIEFDGCDMLLVDSHHVYEQVVAELALAGNKVNKFICFHDTVLYGEHGQDPGSRGINPAINEFMTSNPHWKVLNNYTNNNGMLVIGR